MNCQDFESVSVELARGSLIDAAALASAESHADACASCDARLRRERTLTSALGEVGAEMRDREAPARVEAALLATFRERRGGANVRVSNAGRDATTTPIIPLAPTRFAMNVRRALVVAAIAASVAVALFVVRRAASTNASSRDTTQVAAGKSRSPATVNTQDAQRQIDRRSQTSIDHDRLSSNAITVAGVAPSKSRAPRRDASRKMNDAMDALPISFKEDGGRIVFSESGAVAQGTSNPATSTGGASSSSTADFVPLMTADGSTPLDGGQMVRVRVPRAALAALGLPVSGERAGETVKADVLLAQDGTARAIRLLP